MNNFVQNETDQFGSFQTDWPQLAQLAPEQQEALEAWAQSTDGQFQFLQNYTGTTPPAGASTATVDPAGTYSGAGASSPTPAAAGTYIPVTGATSAAVEIVDPAGTYSGPGASAPTPAAPGRRYYPLSLARPLPERKSSTLRAITVRRARARQRSTPPARTAAPGPARLSLAAAGDVYSGDRGDLVRSGNCRPCRLLQPGGRERAYACAARLLCPDSRREQRDAGRSRLLHAVLGRDGGGPGAVAGHIRAL